MNDGISQGIDRQLKIIQTFLSLITNFPTRDAFAISYGLCLLGNGERPQFLQLKYLDKTFTLEPIESVLTNYHQFLRKVCLSTPSPI